MPKLNMSIPHQLPAEEALARSKSRIGQLTGQFADKITNWQEQWNGNIGNFSFSAMGFSVAGSLTVNASDVEINADLPFAASFYKSKIEAAIRENVTGWLA